jgi:ornithine cyclodeaminase/alanine dehydrogenase-like protein (mu-crystallin family)
MPAASQDTMGLKLVSFYPRNAGSDIPTIIALVLLVKPDTGEPIAMLDGRTLTAMRTAAVSAAVTNRLAAQDSRVLALLGSGAQAEMHLEALRHVRTFDEVRVWSRTPEHAEALALEAHGIACETVEEALDGADVVCTCTASREPVVRREWLAPGTHLNAVGASIPSARELDADVVADASLFVDRRESTLNESGDYLRAVEERGIGPDHILAELGELLTGTHPGRRDETELTVFKSLGIAVEDLAAAVLCVERAHERGIGTEVDF